MENMTDPFNDLTNTTAASPVREVKSEIEPEIVVNMDNVRLVGALMNLREWNKDTNPLLTPEEVLSTPGLIFVKNHVKCMCARKCDNPSDITIENMANSSRARFAAPSVHCAECRKLGHDAVPNLKEDAFLHAQSLEHAKAEAHEKALSQWYARVPKKFHNADVSKDEFVLDRIERYRNGIPSGFIVTGSYGTGKTWMAYGFLNALINKDIVHPSEVLFGSENELLGIISMGTFAEQEEARKRLMDPKYKIVYIDDVGQGNFRSSRDAHSIWNQCVDGIWSSDRVLIVSTNYSLSAQEVLPGAKYQPSQFEEWIGGAAMDRMGGVSGYCVQIMGVSDDSNYRRLNSQKIEEAWRDILPSLTEGDS